MISPGPHSHLSPSRWRSFPLLGVLAVAAVFSASASSHADVVRITSVNGDYQANHLEQVDVRPGDVITLSADVFTDNNDGNGLQAQNRYAEDFVWSADDRSGDECDVSQGQSCLGATNFEVNNYGVSFYVPNNLTSSQVTLRVRSSSTYGSEDMIVLRNTAYIDTPSYTPPTEVVTDPAQYNNGSFDPYTSLAGHGRWVIVGGVRYFVPYTYTPNWVPYQHGYWAWGEDGYTWVSYDPWGWVTDHYGCWRHHETYGWTWLPFDDFRYHPHCVTFFHDNDGSIGWYPYHDGWRNGYRHGYEEGFNDGYWAGYNAGRYYGENSNYYPGFTVVRFGDFRSVNIYGVQVTYAEGCNAWRRGYAGNYYGVYPGGATAWESRQWLEGRVGGGIPQVVVTGRPYGQFELRYPVGIHPVPPMYQHPGYIAAGSLNHPLPVGASFHPGVNGGAPVVVLPTRDGRGIATPPRVFDPTHNVYHPLPPATAHPVQANPANGVYHPAPAPAHPVTPPAYHPGQPPVVNQPPRPQPPVFNPHPGQPPVVNPGQPSNPGHPPVMNPGHPPVVNPGQPGNPGHPPVVNPGQPSNPGHPPVVNPGHPPVVNPGQPGNPGHPPIVSPPHPPVNNPAPPAYHPPVNNPAPPAYHPPVNNPAPPAYHPPVNNPAPPAYHPPVNNPAPPAYHPPVNNPAPPAYHPPVNNPAPPAYHPPVNNPAPPAYHPPVNNPAPPAYHPPVNNPAPPAYHPPVNNPAPPAYHPPVNNPAPPAYHPPVNNPAPPAYHPPSPPSSGGPRPPAPGPHH